MRWGLSFTLNVIKTHKENSLGRSKTIFRGNPVHLKVGREQRSNDTWCEHWVSCAIGSLPNAISRIHLGWLATAWVPWYSLIGHRFARSNYRKDLSCCWHGSSLCSPWLQPRLSSSASLMLVHISTFPVTTVLRETLHCPQNHLPEPVSGLHLQSKLQTSEDLVRILRELSRDDTSLGSMLSLVTMAGLASYPMLPS